MVSVQLALPMHGTVVLIIRRSKVRAPTRPTPVVFSIKYFRPASMRRPGPTGLSSAVRVSAGGGACVRLAVPNGCPSRRISERSIWQATFIDFTWPLGWCAHHEIDKNGGLGAWKNIPTIDTVL